MNGLRLLGHPLHAAIVHFPVASWTAVVASDVLFLVLHDPLWWNLSRWLLVVGVVTALGAMTAGFIDLVALPAGGSAQRRALRHMYFMGSAWTVFLADLLARFLGTSGDPSSFLAWVGAGLSLIGFVVLFAGTHVGAQLVYDLGVGQTGKKLD